MGGIILWAGAPGGIQKRNRADKAFSLSLLPDCYDVNCSVTLSIPQQTDTFETMSQTKIFFPIRYLAQVFGQSDKVNTEDHIKKCFYPLVRIKEHMERVLGCSLYSMNEAVGSILSLALIKSVCSCRNHERACLLMVEGEIQLSKAVLWPPHTCCGMYTHIVTQTRMHVHTINNK